MRPLPPCRAEPAPRRAPRPLLPPSPLAPKRALARVASRAAPAGEQAGWDLGAVIRLGDTRQKRKVFHARARWWAGFARRGIWQSAITLPVRSVPSPAIIACPPPLPQPACATHGRTGKVRISLAGGIILPCLLYCTPARVVRCVVHRY